MVAYRHRLPHSSHLVAHTHNSVAAAAALGSAVLPAAQTLNISARAVGHTHTRADPTAEEEDRSSTAAGVGEDNSSLAGCAGRSRDRGGDEVVDYFDFDFDFVGWNCRCVWRAYRWYSLGWRV